MPKTSPQTKESEKIPCQIHDKIQIWHDKDKVRQSVCRDLPTSEHSDGNHYCLLHKPDKNKDGEEFQKIIDERIAEVDAKYKETENFAEDKQKTARQNLTCDFRFVWFPSDINFSGIKFSGDAYFGSAAFSGYAPFTSAKIEESAQIFFSPTSFQYVSFQQSVIKGYLYFEAGKGEFWNGKWEDEAKTKPKKIERETKVFEDKLDFSQIRTDKPERITFNKVRLHPSWFVNTDSRKFVSTDIDWKNNKAKKVNWKPNWKV